MCGMHKHPAHEDHNNYGDYDYPVSHINTLSYLAYKQVPMLCLCAKVVRVYLLL